jgi:hypothetical protein
MTVKYKGMWSRWHRYDDTGFKQIKKFKIDETPTPLVEDGYSMWQRGTGKLTDEHYKNVTEAVRNACVGVPKSDEQKEKMRQAKLGVPKSEEHKQNMKLSWQKKRQDKYKDAMMMLQRMRQA